MQINLFAEGSHRFLLSNAVEMLSPMAPPFRYVRFPPRSSSRVCEPSINSKTSAEDSGGSNWFQIIHGRPVRICSLMDSPCVSVGQDVAQPPWLSKNSPSVSLPSRYPGRQWGNPGDDVIIRADCFVSIRNLGQNGPPHYCRRWGQKGEAQEAVVTRVSSHANENPSNHSQHLDSLVSHLWCPPTVPRSS
jgi:hypothetical protein